MSDLFDRHASLNTTAQGPMCHPKHFSCLWDGHAPAIQFYERAATTVLRLFRLRNPATVVRLVIAVMVFSLDGVSAMAWTHVGIEVLEGIEPSLANRDASAAVILKDGRLWPQTSVTHRGPRAMLSRLGHAMSGHPRSGLLSSDTSATRVRPRSQSSSVYDGGITTVAEAFPFRMGNTARKSLEAVESNHNKLVDALPSQVFSDVLGWRGSSQFSFPSCRDSSEYCALVNMHVTTVNMWRPNRDVGAIGL